MKLRKGSLAAAGYLTCDTEQKVSSQQLSVTLHYTSRKTVGKTQ